MFNPYFDAAEMFVLKPDVGYVADGTGILNLDLYWKVQARRSMRADAHEPARDT